MSYNQFKPGDKVLYMDNTVYTVIKQLGCQVWLFELNGGWIHPNNLRLA